MLKQCCSYKQNLRASRSRTRAIAAAYVAGRTFRPPRAAHGVSARPGGRRGRRHGREEGRRGEEEDRSQGGWWGSLEAKQIDRWPPRWQDGLKDGPGEARGPKGAQRAPRPKPAHQGPGTCEQFRRSQPQESCLQRGGARPRATIATTPSCGRRASQ